MTSYNHLQRAARHMTSHHVTSDRPCAARSAGAIPGSPSRLSDQRMQIPSPAKRILTDPSSSYQGGSSQ